MNPENFEFTDIYLENNILIGPNTNRNQDVQDFFNTKNNVKTNRCFTVICICLVFIAIYFIIKILHIII